MKKMIIPFALTFLMLSSSCKNNSNTTSETFVEHADIERTIAYLQEFQKIANNNNNNRAVGTPGGIASTEFIVKKLKEFGLEPIVQEFTNTKGNKGKNVIVEIKGSSDKVTMVGAHYDSVEFGPGINDNATGTAVLLEIISLLQSQKITPNHTLRFAFWDSEEIGVAGSKYYVSQLNETDKNNLAHYINVDMVGTKDPKLLITDGDGSSWKQLEEKMVASAETEEEKQTNQTIFENLKKTYPVQVKGAEKLEQIYSSYLQSKNIAFTDDYLLSNNTDVFPFLGITPTFGIVMTNEHLEDSGELLYAPCYHQACDTLDNVDKNSLQLALESISYLLFEIAIK